MAAINNSTGGVYQMPALQNNTGKMTVIKKKSTEKWKVEDKTQEMAGVTAMA